MNFIDNMKNYKQDIAINIKSIIIDKLYWIVFGVAVIIAVLGLLLNSTPVVIGAMLVAPLLRPIILLSFAVSNVHHNDMMKNFKVIFLSTILGIFLSYLTAKALPFQIETSEILSRTNPNILDLFVALFSSVIAFLALIYRNWLAENIAGVAIATSLVPPLAVVGIEISLGNYLLAWSSFLLYFTNLITILFVGIILFLSFGFRPHQEEDEFVFKRNIFLLLFIFSVISVPLLASMINFKNEYLIRKNIENGMEKYLIEKLEVSEKKGKYDLSLELKYYSNKEKEKIISNLKKIKKELEGEGIEFKNIRIELVKAEKVSI